MGPSQKNVQYLLVSYNRIIKNILVIPSSKQEVNSRR